VSRHRKTRITLWRTAVWACLIVIAFATLVPSGFRPETGFPPSIERFAAFVLAAALFAAADPRHILFAAMIDRAVALSSCCSRPAMFDAAVKIGGGVFGIAVGWLSTHLLSQQAEP
jgi:hypothetical protein